MIICRVTAWVIEQDLSNVVVCEHGERILEPIHQGLLGIPALGNEEGSFIDFVLQAALALSSKHYRQIFYP
jgi:hypothetical protein